MAKQIFLCSVAAAALATMVHAADPPPAAPEFANPAFANPDTPGLLDGKPAPNVPNTADIAFLQQLAIGGRAEVALGKLAGERPVGLEPAGVVVGRRRVGDAHREHNVHVV